MTCRREGCKAQVTPKAPGTGGPTLYCSTKCRKGASDDRRRATCPRCGGPMGSGSAQPAKRCRLERCRECENEDRAASHEAQVQKVARLYNLGLTVKEIAAEMGYGENSRPPQIAEAHRRGLISYRYKAYETR